MRNLLLILMMGMIGTVLCAQSTTYDLKVTTQDTVVATQVNPGAYFIVDKQTSTMDNIQPGTMRVDSVRIETLFYEQDGVQYILSNNVRQLKFLGFKDPPSGLPQADNK